MVLPVLKVYVAPLETSAELNTTVSNCLGEVTSASTVPLESVIVTVVPAEPETDAATHDWDDVESGVSAMPELPSASTVPPVTSMPPLESSAPFPLFVGPKTTVCPPEITIVPLESRPSPSASIVTMPPEIVSVSPEFCIPPPPMPPLELPLAALRPSSLAVTSTVPPEIAMSAPSIPS